MAAAGGGGGGGGGAPGSGTGLADMDALCLAQLLSHTSPEDACRLAEVCKEWSQAAASDIVWENFLPAGYQQYVNDSQPQPPKYSNLQELYRLLSGKGLLIDLGKQIVKIRRSSRSLEMYVSVAEGMEIVWGDHKQYWMMEEGIPGSKFSRTAHLIAVCWFKLEASLQCRLPPGRYSVLWRLARDPTRARVPNMHMRRGRREMLALPGPGLARGVMFSWTRGKAYSKVTADGGEERAVEMEVTIETVGECGREWSELEVGEVEVGESEEARGLGKVEVQVELSQLDDSWKSGLYVDSLVLRQKV